MAEPLNATFFAFQKREKGGVLLGASISFLALMIVLLIGFGVAVWAVMGQDFFTWSQQMAQMSAKPAPGQLPANFGRILLVFPIEMIWFFLIFVGLAAYESSCLRWMIRGERSSPMNLHFGADMWRVYGTYWVWFLFFLGTWIVFWIVLLAAGAVAAMIAGRDNPAIAGFLVFGVCVIWVLGWTYVATRLAPASATSVGVREFAPLKAWTVSEGRFWALFGSYFLLFVLYTIAIVAVSAVFFGAMYANILGRLDWTSLGADPQGFSRRYNELVMQQFANPLSIALYIAGQVANYAVGAVFWLMFYGVNARALIAAAKDGKVQAPGIDVAEQFS